MPTQATQQEQRDRQEYRQRVATYVDGTTVSYEDTKFISSESPVVLDVFSDLGRPGHQGYVRNDGPSKLKVEISADGESYGGLHSLKEGDTYTLDDLKVNRIRLTIVDGPLAYRVSVA
jgi:hypothetical protein